MNFDRRLQRLFESYRQESLNPKLWDGEELREDIKTNLLDIAADFAEEYRIPEDAIEDIILTGSLANYTWTQYSDIDLHLVVDFSKVNDDKELVFEYYRLAKSVWNNNHAIEVCGYEVEVYVQDHLEEHHSTGVYSLQTDEWLAKPQKDSTTPPSPKRVDTKADNYILQINKIDEMMQKNDLDAADMAERLKDKIKKMRKAGLESGGEYSIENLVFKKLRNEGYLDKLSTLRKQLYDLKMSVQQCPTD